MNECTQPCHDLHDMHKKHCEDKAERKPPTEKQEAFFEKLREEGRKQIRDKIKNIQDDWDANGYPYEGSQGLYKALLILLRSKL